ncbi:MAG TPA: glycerol-3-phosphate dehydrogenase/oxidase [Nocardioidaceae bacterium]|nr:glycerol-3-phosphate dehydrogenase/oxidase [Nocardioidaceae bacterium]
MNVPAVDPGASLNARRRATELSDLSARGGRPVDVLVIGGGVTGAGVALDAAARGLTVVLAERHDLAFGTSRWSSKLVHGGLRYLATGDLSVARESAVERGILLERTAPHLVHPVPQLFPLHEGITRRAEAVIRAGCRAGDLLRRSAGTSAQLLPRSRRAGREETLQLAPGVRPDGLRGGVLLWEGRLTDDARLVVCLARTAARHGARILTRCAAEQITGRGAVLRDTLTGEQYGVDARTVVNAAGVWAGEVAPGIRLRPSRGSHLVLPASCFAGQRAVLTVPVPHTSNRFVMAIPAPDGRVYVGLTDRDAPGPVPDVPEPTPDEVDFLLDTVNGVVQRPVGRGELCGTFAGLRPLLDSPGRSADISRRHAVITASDGLVTVVGGKLTTYRRMAEDALDAALAAGGLDAAPCRTATLPLVGAAPRVTLARVAAPLRLVERYGVEAPAVLAEAAGDPALLEPLGGTPVTGAELLFAVRHEGALDASDLLDRRTRIGLDDADRDRVLPRAQELVGEHARVMREC